MQSPQKNKKATFEVAFRIPPNSASTCGECGAKFLRSSSHRRKAVA